MFFLGCSLLLLSHNDCPLPEATVKVYGYSAIKPPNGDFWMNRWINNGCDIDVRGYDLQPVPYQR